ncbi:hypothetical protein TTHERM_00328620 (macronuclear) [Tetrahymena thermophila SB210]|uniref:Uncharacterized protein n=1 Tax=Tetrahymena thermophila (strain SB210) TaxID=312017 RepID=I7LXV7_TETTS|nr:hypothetical protein TTHERM_00328620 [Tetrahymena thermophila SB210]EAS06281.4 hypothetical protein TTHERM_00328620 [Tetrahymena thermophila SB210]|eukprot:XP_001026526.4 hypothetical protein TTHERM_00328620 [Tetrahymena thermophila SB210]
MIQQSSKNTLKLFRLFNSLCNQQIYKINSFNLANEMPKGAFDSDERSYQNQETNQQKSQPQQNYQKKQYYSNNQQQGQTATVGGYQKLPFQAWNDSIYIAGQTHTIYIIPIPVQMIQRKASLGLSSRFHGLLFQFSKNVPKQNDSMPQQKHINAKYFRIGLDQLDKIIYHDIDSQNAKDLYLVETTSIENKYLRFQKDTEKSQVKLSVRFKSQDGQESNDKIDIEFPITKFKFLQDNIKLSLPYLSGWAFTSQQFQQKNMNAGNPVDDM